MYSTLAQPAHAHTSLRRAHTRAQNTRAPCRSLSPPRSSSLWRRRQNTSRGLTPWTKRREKICFYSPSPSIFHLFTSPIAISAPSPPQDLEAFFSLRLQIRERCVPVDFPWAWGVAEWTNHLDLLRRKEPNHAFC